jgi:hypothetical protein
MMVAAAAPTHWSVVVTDQRLLIFRLFETRPPHRDSGMELADSCDLAEVRIDRAGWGRLGGHLDVDLRGQGYEFRFPARPAAARAVVDALAGRRS